jgi:histidinol phosphatase-like enzyme
MEFHSAKRLSEEDQQKVALVDIDETICYYEDPNNRRYNLSIPIQENIDKINKLYDEGWKIVYWTARGSVSKKDYTESPNPKPHFDLVIDDKAKRIEEL